MSNSKAFTKTIYPSSFEESKGSAADFQEAEFNQGIDSHQTSPCWVVTFVRWANRDTYRTSTVPADAMRSLLVAENDCIAVSTADSKSTLTPTVSITLLETDINYSTAIGPGDFVIVNMLNWESDARRVALAAKSGEAINHINDGFKGVYKIQGVRKSVVVEPSSGTKHVAYKITGYAFTEFNNVIYFNNALIDRADTTSDLIFAANIGKEWKNLFQPGKKGFTNVQNFIEFFINSFIGSGVTPTGRELKGGLKRNFNTHYMIPKELGKLLGIPNAVAAKDIFAYIFGVQTYSPEADKSISENFNPSKLTRRSGNLFFTDTPCEGEVFNKPEYWNQVKVWAILNQFTNAPLNELYTTFKVAPDGSVLPTVIFRQIPFTTDGFKYSGVVTRFLSLPRWKISETLVREVDIGRDESARINFVQVFGKSSLSVGGGDISLEVAKGNYSYDPDDIQRSGLRPYVVNSTFDELTDNKDRFKSPEWAKLIGDSLIGGHLKLNGTLVCAGIVDPIAVGENLEFDGVVYHIEMVSHQCSIQPGTGRKSFFTTIGLSSGVALTDRQQIGYGEMANPAAKQDRERDNAHSHILPGISESQDIVSRPSDLDKSTTTNTPYVQPNRNGQK